MEETEGLEATPPTQHANSEKKHFNGDPFPDVRYETLYTDLFMAFVSLVFIR